MAMLVHVPISDKKLAIYTDVLYAHNDFLIENFYCR